MILALDMGNTNIVVGGIDNEKTYFVERITTDLVKTSLEYAVSIKNILEIHHTDVSVIQGAIISSVVPPLNAALSSAIKKILGFRPKLVGSGMKTGLNIHMDDPKSVGSDLIVGAVAALLEYPCPLIVIDMGTATTICAVDKSGSYIGGIIYPGLKISLETLASKTAQLPNISLDIPDRVIGKNTIQCMRSGIIYGSAGMLDGILDRMTLELGEDAVIIATGGLSRFITPLCRHTIIYEEDLMLKGLLALYNKNN